MIISLLGIFTSYTHILKLVGRGGRASLSHVEIAKAFDASLLASTDSNGTAAQLLDQAGSKGVRYGETQQRSNSEDIDVAVSFRLRKHTMNRATFIVSQVNPRATWLRFYPCLTLSFGICRFFFQR